MYSKSIIFDLFRNHGKLTFTLEGIGETKVDTVDYRQEIEALEKDLEYAEIGKAVEWAIEEYEEFTLNTSEDRTIYIHPLLGESVELLEAYRQSQKEVE